MTPTGKRFFRIWLRTSKIFCFRFVRPYREPQRSGINHRSEKYIWNRHGTEGLLGLFEPGMAKTILIPMVDWCGSTSIDLSDRIEAMGAEEGKQRKRRLNRILWSSEKVAIFLHVEVSFNMTRTLMGVPESIRIQFSIPQKTFALILVGKKSGIKMKRYDRVELADIFALIDAMPMRRQEMRQKGQRD